MIQLREDQEEVRARTRVSLRSNASVLVYAPPGWGKTVFSAALMQLIFNGKKRVIFAVHRIPLIKQTAETLKKFGIPFSYIANGHHYNPYHRVFIASIDTLKNRLGKIPADYLFIDEAHLSMAAGWVAVVNHYIEAGAKIIGLTGSPMRLDGKPLGDIWGDMVMGPSPRWLIDNGFLSRYRAFSPDGFDGTEKAVLSNAVKHWRERAAGKRTIGFAPSVARAYELAEEFRRNGIRAVAMDAETPQTERNVAFNAIADGQLDVIFNKSLFCEGFDLSAQVGRDVTIECVLDLDRTNSLARHIQKTMRCMRKKPDHGILIDMVGALRRDDLGLPDWDREWSLTGADNGKRTGGGSAVGARTCPSCYATHAPSPTCTNCGHVYQVKERKLEEVDGKLEEIDVEAQRRQKQREQQKAESLQDLINLARSRNYKSPEKWAAHILTARAAKKGEVSREAEKLGVLSMRELERRTGVNAKTLEYWFKTGVIKAKTYEGAALEIQKERDARILKCSDIAREIDADRSVVARWARVEGMPLTSIEDAMQWIKENKPERLERAA